MTHFGRDEVARRRTKLRDLIAAIDGAGLDAELTSHYARYLCVLVSGHAEQSVKELVAHYCRRRCPEQVQRYVGAQLKRLHNIDLEKLRQLVRSFSAEWWDDLERDRADELSAFEACLPREMQSHMESKPAVSRYLP
jgi:hypothetical protein